MLNALREYPFFAFLVLIRVLDAFKPSEPHLVPFLVEDKALTERQVPLSDAHPVVYFTALGSAHTPAGHLRLGPTQPHCPPHRLKQDETCDTQTQTISSAPYNEGI